MRRVGQVQVALGAAAVLVAAPIHGRADPPPAAAAHATISAPVKEDPSAAYYPAAARAAGVEGSATIRCSRDEHLALIRCTLVSETPTGQGFGAAALAMAARSPENPKVDLPALKSEASADTTLRFTLHPAKVAPDITQIQAAYPVRALSDQVEGGAIIVCAVTRQGGLASCRVGREAPAGYGFGQAAVDLAPDFKMAPAEVDTQPIDGAPIAITVPFRVADPDAPLTLGAKPAAGN